MKVFKNTATLMRRKRIQKDMDQKAVWDQVHPGGNYQFLSNIERSLCAPPMKKLQGICNALNISSDEIKMALTKDLHETVDLFLVEKKDEIKILL